MKDPNTGIWNQVKAYKRSDFPHPFGHGAASMYMAQRMFKLTEEEALAIRWHQGRWNVCASLSKTNTSKLANGIRWCI